MPIRGIPVSLGRGGCQHQPIVISINAIKLYEQQILIYHPTSQVVHHPMIDDWLNHHFPELMPKNGFRKRTDGSNFHLIVHEAQRLTKQQNG